MIRGLTTRLLAVAAAGVCCAGLFHAAKAGISQAEYYRAKYKATGSEAREVLARCEKAHRLYPWNYNLCLVAAESAFADVISRASGAAGDFSESLAWCDKGLKLDQWNRELTYRKAVILGVDPATRTQGIDLWSKYVDWDFWTPANHLYLGLMYAGAGDFDSAKKEANWARSVPGIEALDQAITAGHTR